MISENMHVSEKEAEYRTDHSAGNDCSIKESDSFHRINDTLLMHYDFSQECVTNIDMQLFFEKESALLDSTTDITLPIESCLNKLSKDGIRLYKVADISNYLINHPSILDLIKDLCRFIKNLFNAKAQISIELYNDAEIEDEFLMIVIRPEEYDADIMDKINYIESQYKDKLNYKSGWLIVTTDFCPPQK